MHYASLARCIHIALQIGLKRTYFMAVINGVFCLDVRVIYKRETLLIITLEWSEIMGTYKL